MSTLRVYYRRSFIKDCKWREVQEQRDFPGDTGISRAYASIMRDSKCDRLTHVLLPDQPKPEPAAPQERMTEQNLISGADMFAAQSTKPETKL